MRCRTTLPRTPGNTILRAGAAVTFTLLILPNLWVSTRPAASQSVCKTHKEITRDLEHKFSEVPVAAGPVDERTLIQVFAQADGKSWTLVVSRADGMTCPFANGEIWRAKPSKNHRRGS